MRSLLLGPKIVPTEAVEVDDTHPLGATLTAFWPLGKDIRDVTGNNPTSASGALTFVGSNRGPALNFPNAGHLIIPDSPYVGFNGGSFTASVWINVSAFGSYTALFGKTNVNQPAPYDSYISANTSFVIYCTGGVTTLNYTFSTNTWYNIVFSISAVSGINIYIDGVLEATASGAISLADTNYPLFLGSRGDGVTQLNGLMSAASLRNGILSPDLIAWGYAEPFAMLVPKRRPWRVYLPSGAINIVQIDWSSPAATRATIQPDALLPAASTGSLRLDGPIPAAVLASLRGDANTQAAWLTTAWGPSASPAETSGTAVAGIAPGAETTGTAWSKARTRIENSALSVTDTPVPQEWTGSGMSVSAADSLALEWTASASGLSGIAAEWAGISISVQTDASLPLEWSVGMAAITPFPLKGSGSSSQTSTLNGETLSGVRGTAALGLGFLSGLSGVSSFPDVWVATGARNKPPIFT